VVNVGYGKGAERTNKGMLRTHLLGVWRTLAATGYLMQITISFVELARDTQKRKIWGDERRAAADFAEELASDLANDPASHLLYATCAISPLN